MLNVNFEAMEEKYLKILRHYINPNDCKTVIQMLLNLHSVVGTLVCDNKGVRCQDSSMDRNGDCRICGEDIAN
tara:strand:+ start:344 stop:562 length:219 start_codon:yes stop_codon:yes gene_type:complete